MELCKAKRNDPRLLYWFSECVTAPCSTWCSVHGTKSLPPLPEELRCQAGCGSKGSVKPMVPMKYALPAVQSQVEES